MVDIANQDNPNNPNNPQEPSPPPSSFGQTPPTAPLQTTPTPVETAQQQPEEPEQFPEPQRPAPVQPKPVPRAPFNIKKLLPIIIILLLIIGSVGYIVFLQPSTTTTTSTIENPNVSLINKCKSIAAPGKYYLSSNIKTSIASGACINITSNNVALICNQNKIIGSGPFISIPPFTYGVWVKGQNNVSINNCVISNFSYGLYVQSSTNVSIYSDNLTTNYMSNIYLNNTHNSSVFNNYVLKSASTLGSIFLTANATYNKIYNNTIQYNQYYGINVNASNNTFRNNYINESKAAFYCSAQQSFLNSGVAVSNRCVNNTGCGFVTCAGTNLPADLSQIQLGNNISGCGSINRPGTYQLAGDINMALFTNLSNHLLYQYMIGCIKINSNNVRLDCKNFTISNATYGIFSINKANITVNKCNIKNTRFGIFFKSVTNSFITNTTAINSNSSVSLIASSADLVSNIKSINVNYSVYLLDSNSNIFNNYTLNSGKYGIYVDTSLGNLFNKGFALNNSKFDVFAALNSANASYNIMQSTNCGLTDAVWAPCAQHIVPTLPYVPINSCQVISRPGNYSLTTNIVNAPSKCFNVQSNDVRLGCMNHRIASVSSNQGTAILVNNKRNVTIDGCGFSGFATGLAAYNSTSIHFNALNLQHVIKGIVLNNISSSSISFSNVSDSSNSSIDLYRVTNSNITFNNFSSGPAGSTGIVVNNSANNRIINNTGYKNFVGISFNGNSLNNTVVNNTMQTDSHADYVCNGNSALDSEIGGVNYGTTKIGCYWLAAIPKGVNPLECGLVDKPDLILLRSDAVYGFGGTCYTVTTNATTIDCNGHTVLSNSGGIFALFSSGGQNNRIQNCRLKGFETPILVQNSGVNVFNNTIMVNKTATPGISVSSSRDARIQGNNVTTTYHGIDMLDDALGYLINNIVRKASVAYQLYNVSSYTIQNNTATKSDQTGMILSNSTTDIFLNNNLTTLGTALVCRFASQNNTVIDQGGNVCTGVSSCSWIKSSSATCH